MIPHTDLVQELRDAWQWEHDKIYLLQAADEIERLRRENLRLQSELDDLIGRLKAMIE